MTTKRTSSQSEAQVDSQSERGLDLISKKYERPLSPMWIFAIAVLVVVGAAAGFVFWKAENVQASENVGSKPTAAPVGWPGAPVRPPPAMPGATDTFDSEAAAVEAAPSALPERQPGSLVAPTQPAQPAPQAAPAPTGSERNMPSAAGQEPRQEAAGTGASDSQDSPVKPEGTSEPAPQNLKLPRIER